MSPSSSELKTKTWRWGGRGVHHPKKKYIQTMYLFSNLAHPPSVSASTSTHGYPHALSAWHIPSTSTSTSTSSPRPRPRSRSRPRPRHPITATLPGCLALPSWAVAKNEALPSNPEPPK